MERYINKFFNLFTEFSLNACILYKRIEILNQDEFITNNKMLFFNLSTTFTDIIISFFAVGFMYSAIKDLKV